MEGTVLGISIADCGAAAAADDFKYVCGLSTILVATIQEVKDRVTQMEFIFSSQLFPHIQAKSKLLHARHADDATATTAAEDEWRKREAGLVGQLEELSSGKQRAEDRLLQLESSLEEMKGRLVDAARLAEEHDAEKKQLLGKLEEEMKGELIRRVQMEIGEKAAEISREREAHQQLLQQMELKDKDLLLEQNRVNHVTAKYKDLKSQYNHLLKKIDQNESSKIDKNEGSKSPVNLKTSGSPPSKRKLKDMQDTEKESIQLVAKTEDQKKDSQ